MVDVKRKKVFPFFMLTFVPYKNNVLCQWQANRILNHCHWFKAPADLYRETKCYVAIFSHFFYTKIEHKDRTFLKFSVIFQQKNLYSFIPPKASKQSDSREKICLPLICDRLGFLLIICTYFEFGLLFQIVIYETGGK